MGSNANPTQSRRAVVVLVLAIACFIAARTHADPDLWGHVLFGREILEHGIPETDSYSYLSGDHSWINHELLPEITYGAVFTYLGVPGLVSLKVVLVLLIIGLIYRRLLNQALHPLRAGIVIVVVLMLMSVGLWTIRPHLFTYLFFLVTLLLIDRADQGSPIALWFLPVVMLVWANSHGGFLAGLGVVAIWVAVTLCVRWFAQGKAITSLSTLSLTCGALACVAATFLNPYGWDLLLFLLRTATVPRPEIGEWQPITIVSPEGVAYVVALFVCGVALARSDRPRRPALWAVLGVTALLPLQALRHIPLFGLSFGVLAAGHLADVWNRLSPTDASSERGLPPALSYVAAAIFVIAAAPHFTCIPIKPAFVSFPARAVAVMKEAQVKGNLATFFDWGEYIIWHLSPDVRVSVDGRRETVYSPESYARSLRFMYGVGEWDEIVDDPQTDMALIGRSQPTYNLMRLKSGWKLMYEDPVSAIFVRPDSMQESALRNVRAPDIPADGSGLCFP